MTVTQRRSDLLRATLQHHHSHSEVLRHLHLLLRQQPVASAPPLPRPLRLHLPLRLDPQHRHRLLPRRHRRLQPSILRHLPLLLEVLLLLRRHHLAVQRLLLVRQTLPPRLRHRNPLALEPRHQLHHRPFLSQDHKVPVLSHRHLDSAQLPPLRSNLPQEALVHRPLVDSEHRHLLRPVVLELHPHSPTSRVLVLRHSEELHRRQALVDSASVPAETPIRAASNVAESFGHEDLPAKAIFYLQHKMIKKILPILTP